MNEQKTTQQTWISAVSNMFQFILGFIVGVTLIAGTAIGAAYYYFQKVSSSVPEKPVYSEENSSSEETVNNSTTDNTEAIAASEVEEVEEVTIVDEQPEIPEGAYYANVTWPQGLSLRAEPDLNAARVGGVSYDAKVLILEESPDQKWQKIQIPWSQQEGWVKAGNTKRASY